ncbi:hypothetical protein [Hymenobacter chitinivorans]|uniref:SdpC family antimicrobial peptide n=1 Tax=Hymenobacter chitinivorans DSM 11115 TaxID=1121954 RepID=A0A2M9BMP2_9BACT|nr:hypothetical protein [Hymenobacter chitinivorans]PJJ59216.1 SdpC family antimicrobial peptide [Hymenobacter chitinivorans DSM 11115]
MLSYFRKSTSFKALGLLAVGTSLMMSCSKEQVQPAATPVAASTEASAQYTGEELFQGIFLMQGRVAAQLPYFAPFRSALDKTLRQHPEQQQKRQQTTQRITQLVKQQNPGYFAELQAAVASQNFSRIEETLRKGAALHKTATLSLSSSAQHRHQAELLKQLDLSKYDLRKQADVERYLSDAKDLGDHAATEAGVAAQLEEGVVIDGGIVLDVAFWYYYAWPLVLYVGADQNSDSQVGEVIQRQANLEKEKLVRDLALLAGSQH